MPASLLRPGSILLGLVALATAGGARAAAADPLELAATCHVPAGKSPAEGETLLLDAAATRAHLAHGDYEGRCRPYPAGFAPGDADGDGVPDPLDNCLVDPNLDQRDTDGDGFGNACDADFDQDGIVDADDQVTLAQAIGRGAHPERMRDLDLNGDGRVDSGDLLRMHQLRGLPPGPCRDADRDGTPDHSDPCPDTAEGAPAAIPGCSALDVLMDADLLVEPIIAHVGDVLGTLGDPGILQREADMATSSLRQAAHLAGAGQPCGAREAAGTARGHVDAMVGMLEALADAARAGAVRDTDESDVALDDTSVSGFLMLARQLQSAGRDVEVLRGALHSACGAARPLTLDGVTLGSIDDAARRLLLADGRSFGLPRVMRSGGVAGRGALVPGSLANLQVIDLGNGSGLVTEVDGGISTRPATVRLTPCVVPAFAPVQALPPFTTASGPLLLPMQGYRQGTTYLVETGMGIGAMTATCVDPASEPLERLDVSITYRDRHDGTTVTADLAHDLRPEDWPALLPWRADPDVPATMTVRTLRCADGAPSCDVVDETTFSLLVKTRGTLARATPDATLFTVDDQVADDHEWSHVVSVGPAPGATWTHDVGTSLGFVGEGRVPFFDGLIRGGVALGQGYAIANSDFFPIHVSNWMQALVASAVTGVSSANGLAWPAVTGTNHGRPFQYAADMPKVVRDAVALCPSSGVHSFYRLPYPAGEKIQQGQGSLSGGTHGNGYAYDMGFACLEDIHAARGGVVWDLREDRVVQYVASCPAGCEDPDNLGSSCNPSCAEHGCSASYQDANVLWIRHQDGSFGQYVHFPLDGIVPEEGDVVRRGELLGVAGTTGRSTGPHLHVAEKTDPSGQGCVMSSTVGGGCTRLMLYQREKDDGTIQNCYEPTPDDWMTSTNVVQ